MKKSRKVIWMVLLIGLALLISCEKSEPTEPETYPNWQDYWTILYESQSLYQITFVSDETAWITAGHDMVYFHNGSFTRIALPEPVEQPYQWWIDRCSFYDANHGLAIGNGNQLNLPLIYGYENGVWSQLKQLEASNYYEDVKALAADDIWVCGSSTGMGACAWHWNGNNWQRYALPPDPYAHHLYFKTPNDGYVTTECCLWNWNGVEWQCEAQFWLNELSDAVKDNQGNNFVAVYQLMELYGIYKEYPEIWRGVPSSYCAQINAMARNNQGDIWAGGTSILLPSYNVLAKWTGQHWIYYRSQPIAYTKSLFVKENGEVWAIIGNYHTCFIAKLNKESLPEGGN